VGVGVGLKMLVKNCLSLNVSHIYSLWGWGEDGEDDEGMSTVLLALTEN